MRESTTEQKLEHLQKKYKELVDVVRPFACYYHPSMTRLEGRIISRAMMPDERGYKSGKDVWLDNNDFKKLYDMYDDAWLDTINF